MFREKKISKNVANRGIPTLWYIASMKTLKNIETDKEKIHCLNMGGEGVKKLMAKRGILA